MTSDPAGKAPGSKIAVPLASRGTGLPTSVPSSSNWTLPTVTGRPVDGSVTVAVKTASWPASGAVSDEVSVSRRLDPG